MMNNDSELYAGGQESTFGNEALTDETRKEVEKEQAEARKSLGNAEVELRALNQEIAQANELTDFFESLQDLPTNIPQPDIRGKMEARLAYLNYLMTRRSRLVSDMEDAGYEIPADLVTIASSMPRHTSPPAEVQQPSVPASDPSSDFYVSRGFVHRLLRRWL